MKKRLLSIVLILAMVMNFGILPVFAAGSATLEISPNTTGLKAGDVVTVTATVPQVSGIASGLLKLTFDKATLEVQSINAPTTFAGYGTTVTSVSTANNVGTFSISIGNGATKNFDMPEALVLSATFVVRNTASAGEKANLVAIDGENYYFEDENSDSVIAPTFNKTSISATVVSAITGNLAVAITAPVKGNVPQSSITETEQYTGAITWEGNPTTFVANTEYTANVTLTAKDGYQFAEGVNPAVTDATISGKSVTNGGKTLTFKAAFDKTGTATLTGILIPGLTVAVPTAKPNETQTKSTPIAVVGVYDDPNINPTVAATLEIVGTAPTGVTLEGNTLKVTNHASAGKVRVLATFEGKTDNKEISITKEGPAATAIVATAPAEGTNITIPNGGTNTSGQCSYKVYDQYGAEMTGSHATWKMKLDPTTVTGVNLIAANGSISVTSDATACKATLYAEGSGVKSNEITFNIARAASVATSLEINVTPDSVNVPTVTEPGTTSSAYATYTATVKDQYGQEMPVQTIEWSFPEKPGVTFNNGQLTVTNKADAGTVTITAKCGTLTANKDVTINKDTAKVSIVKITAQDGEPPVTIITCTGSQRLEYYTATVYDQYGNEKQDDVKWSLDPTVSGVDYEVSETSDNIVTLKVAPNTAAGTFKLVATSQTVGTVKGELDITVQRKTDVSSNINFDNGSLTYNGNGQEYKTATLDSSVTPGTDGHWTYTYAVKSGATGALDAAGLPKIVGTYTVTATYEDSSNIGSKTATLTITAKKVAIPVADPVEYTYDGNEKIYNIPTSPYYTVSGNKQTNANEGGYLVTVALKDSTNTIWSDDTTGVKIYHFYIYKATPTGEPTYTEITASGKTLTDAALGVGTIKPAGGEIAWNDPTSTAVVANTSYGWTYTPADTTNYKPLTGTIKLWNKSTSSGGYYYAPTTAVVPDMPMLYRGCTGDAVKTLQDKLNALGYNSGSVDGIFGAKTYAAVTAFQKANSLGVDGIVGKLTWGKIYGVSPAMPVETTTVVGRPTVSYGSRGDAVRKLQELLNALGYDCGSVDGIFGSKTKAAVLAFQKANGLGVDGIVGPLTWAKLG